jgi:hypothetical protein
MYYIPPDQGFGIAGLLGKNLEELGLPTQQDLIQMYYQKALSFFPHSSLGEINEWFGFYLAFLFFKNCVIVQGVAQRARAGVASSAVANQVGALLPTMIHMTQELLRRRPPPILTSSI